MNTDVAAFANVMKRHGEKLGPMQGVEWMQTESLVEYPNALNVMDSRVAGITAAAQPELIWFLEHPPLYTGGTSAKSSDLFERSPFPVFASGRGGQYTYHGPGQLVAYVMLDLNKRGRDVRCFVHRLEEWVIAALGDYGVNGVRRDGYPGVWIEGAGAVRYEKIAAIGVRVRRWVTLHGVSVNVSPDLSHYAGIVPCGISDAGVTSLKSHGKIG